MGLRSNGASTEIHLRRRVMAFGSLLTVATTLVITLVGLAIHPYVILVTAAAVALVVAGVVLVLTTSGTTRVAGFAIVLAGVVTWVWILVDADAINYVVALAVGAAIATALALLALRPRPYRPPPQDRPTPRKPFILMNERSGGGKVTKFDLDERARAAPGHEQALGGPRHLDAAGGHQPDVRHAGH